MHYGEGFDEYYSCQMEHTLDTDSGKILSYICHQTIENY